MSSRTRSFSIVVIALVTGPVAACALETNGLDPHAIDGLFDASSVVPAPDASTSGADGAAAADADGRDATSPIADATSPDTSTSAPDASIDAGAEAGNPCDVDGDGHRSKDSVCLGDDCCDTDNATHPGQTGWFAARNTCGSFDYDCNGQETAETGTVNCQLGFFSCSGDGFDAPTGCGVTSLYTSCGYAGFGCNHNDDMRAQRCH